MVMQGGTIRNATLSFSGGAQLIFGSGSLDGLTVNSDLGVGNLINGATLVVVNGLTLNSTLRVGNPTNGWPGGVSFAGTQTLNGNGTVVFGNSQCNRLVLITPNTGLTLGAGITVTGHTGTIGQDGICFGPASGVTVTNLGTIRANQAGGIIHIRGNPAVNLGSIEASDGGSLILNNLVDVSGVRLTGGGMLNLQGIWANTGVLAVNAATLTLQGSWTNTGSINFTNTTLNLAGTLRLSGLGTLNRSGGVVNLQGVLDAEGTPLELNGTTGSWVMQGGTIRNATLNFSGGAQLIFGGGSFDGVTVNGDLDVGRTVNGANLQVFNGLTLNGTLYLGNPINTWQGAVSFSGTQLLGGNATVILGNSQCNRLVLASPNSGLTLGADLKISGHSGVIGQDGVCGGALGGLAVTNLGTIHANGAGGNAHLRGVVVVNLGTVRVGDGGTSSDN